MKVKSFVIILSLIASIMIFSGCTSKDETIFSYIFVDLIENHEIIENHVIKNITSTDLIPYPTLQEALEEFFIPNNVLTSTHIKVSAADSINMENTGLLTYINYNNEYFQLGYIIFD